MLDANKVVSSVPLDAFGFNKPRRICLVIPAALDKTLRRAVEQNQSPLNSTRPFGGASEKPTGFPRAIEGDGALNPVF